MGSFSTRTITRSLESVNNGFQLWFYIWADKEEDEDDNDN